MTYADIQEAMRDAMEMERNSILQDADGMKMDWIGVEMELSATGREDLAEWVHNEIDCLRKIETTARYEAIGWCHAFCCAALDDGLDQRTIEAPAILEKAKAQLENAIERRVGRLAWDVARCTGERLDGQCAVRMDCRRHTELADAGPLTMRFYAPTDAPLSVGCELMIAKPDH